MCVLMTTSDVFCLEAGPAFMHTKEQPLAYRHTRARAAYNSDMTNYSND